MTVAAAHSPMIDHLLDRHIEDHSLLRDFYTDPDILSAEMQRVFGATWLYAGHVAELARPGDYVLRQIADEQIILVRDKDDAIRAFFNTCRHRGAAICAQEKGHVARFVCPYHQWTFGLDGSLIAARLMPEDFDKASHGLWPLAVAVAEGLIFIHFNPEASPPEELLAATKAWFGPYELGQAKIAHEQRWVVQANWKLVEENSRECYHCRIGHPQYVAAVGFAAGVDSEEDARLEATMRESLDERAAALGLSAPPCPARPGGWFHIRRFPLNPGFISESMDGNRVAPLLGRVPAEDVGAVVLVGLPNILMEVSCDYAMILRVSPLNARETETHSQWLVRADAEEGRDYDVERLTQFWRMTHEQDWGLCETNQRGVNSTRYSPGPYAPRERGVKNFIRWYIDKMRA